MINFFRKIRKKMADDNRPLRYARYAIGEIGLVVIGILLALQLNTWKTNSNNKKQERILLTELQGEYQDKLKELEEKVNIRNYMISSGNLILKAIYDKNYGIPLDSFYRATGSLTLTPTYDASNSVTDEMINSGKLYLIENKELRKLILDWPSTLTKMTEEEQMYVQLAINKFYPYFIDNFPMRNSINPLLENNNELKKNWLKTSLNSTDRLKSSNLPIDLKTIFNDLIFENTVSFINTQMVVANMQSQDVRAHIDKVLKNIESELRK